MTMRISEVSAATATAIYQTPKATESEWIAKVNEAFASPKVQAALKTLAEHYQPHQEYPNAIKTP
ncbi:MAG: hypothetical protein BWK78_06225 [Thiotrichaceae bacterium IS1]|nr:MAG: hypothetical protein BWK78_06225 [Thiotrichaceae bacterium IS1]